MTDEFQYVKLPDGSYGKFAANASDADIHAQISKDFPDAMRGQQRGFFGSALDSSGLSSLPQLIAHPIDSVTGAVKQAGTNITDAYKTAKEQGFTSDAGRHAFVKAVPIIGPIAATAGQQMLDKNYAGAAGTVAGAGLGAIAPELGARAIGSLRAVAPSVAEGALGIGKLDRINGASPGRAVLDETNMVRPESIYRHGKQVVSDLVKQVDAAADAHTGPVSIQGGQDVVTRAITRAKKGNAKLNVNALEPLREQVTENLYGNPQPFAAPTVGAPSTDLAPMQTARAALDLKRGIRSQFVKNWSPELAPAVARDTAKGASGAIDASLDSVLGPEYTEANRRMSSLIPVVEAAESTSRGANLAQKVIGRARAHSGALIPGIAAATAGAAQHGLLGGAIGGALGVAVPEMIGGPTATMIMARGLNSRIPSMAARPLIATPYLTRRGDSQ